MNTTGTDEYRELRDKVQLLEIKIARFEEQLVAAAAALVIAQRALEHAQAVSNEWRKENLDQRALYPTIEKVEGMISILHTELRSLDARVRVGESGDTKAEGSKKAFSAVWAAAIVLVGWAIAAVIYFTR